MTEAAASVSGTRRLLRRLRGHHAGSGTAQERLDRIVVSLPPRWWRSVFGYVMRAGEGSRAFSPRRGCVRKPSTGRGCAS